MSVSRCSSFVVDCPINRWYKKVDYEKDRSTLVQLFDGQLLSWLGLSFVVLHLPFSHLCSAEHFDYWARNCVFELCLPLHARRIFAAWHKFNLIAILLVHRQSHYIESSGWWRELKVSHLLCLPTAPVFAYYSS